MATRIAPTRGPARATSPLASYAAMLAAALAGALAISEGLAAAGVDRRYTLLAGALACSAWMAYRRTRLDAAAPCACRHEGRTATVLRSPEAALLGVPNAVVGIAVSAAMLVLVATGRALPAVILAAGCVAASAYLGRAMVARIRVVCPACVTVAALNALILVDLVR